MDNRAYYASGHLLDNRLCMFYSQEKKGSASIATWNWRHASCYDDKKNIGQPDYGQGYDQAGYGQPTYYQQPYGQQPIGYNKPNYNNTGYGGGYGGLPGYNASPGNGYEDSGNNGAYNQGPIVRPNN